MEVLSIFRNNWWLRMLKSVNKEKLRCPGGFFEEIKSICYKKCLIFRQIKKNPKLFSFLKFSCTFCLFTEKPGSLDFRRSTILFNKEQIRCPTGYCLEKKNEKRFKMRPKLAKIPKCINFSGFYATFFQFTGNFMNQMLKMFNNE